MVPIPYISNGNNSGTIRLSKSIKSGDLISFIIPYILKAGVFLQRTSGLYLNANILYGNYSFTTIDSEHDFQCTGDRYGSCSWEGVYLSGLNFEQKLLGWNIRVGRGYYNKNSNGALFIGGGALTDYGSRMYSHGGFVINKELKNTYPFWEIGIVFSLNHIFFIEGTYRFMFDGKPSEDFVSTASLNLGAGIFLPLW